MAAKDVATALENAMDQTTTGVHAAIDRASEAARPTVDKITLGAHQVVDQLASSATHAAEALEVKGDQLREAQSQLTERCRIQIREHPVATLGLAVAAGFLLNWWMSKR